MTSTQTLMTQIVLRHRTSDYVRFSLPDALCREDIARYLEQGLHQVEGVRRVVVHQRQRKLSVFCLPHVCEFSDIVHKLERLINLLAAHDWIEEPSVSSPEPHGLRKRLREIRPFRRIRDRYRAWKAEKIGLVTVAKAQWKDNPVLRLMGNDPEKAFFSFANDLVTFYLIRVHWNLIVNNWLKRPLKFRYEWLTAFYLVLLLVRSRRKG